MVREGQGGLDLVRGVNGPEDGRSTRREHAVNSRSKRAEDTK